MSEVVLEQLTKYFGEVKAVDNVNLKIRKREFLTLLGPIWLWKNHDPKVDRWIGETYEG